MPSLARSLRLTVITVLTAFALVTLGPAAARAASPSPAITLTSSAPAEVLFGSPATETMTAADPSGQPTGYNLSFRDVLPAGISYVAGSSSVGGSSVSPQVFPGAPSAGQTTLVWSNVSDLSPRSSATLTYKVSASTTTLAVGDSYSEQQSAYVNSSPRTVPAFTTAGAYSSGATGTATSSSTSRLSALAVTASDNDGGELLRGVHDHQTVYTLTVANNGVKPTTSAALDSYLPAGLEFLGCGQTDNTTDVPSNPGSAAEYPGAGPLSGNIAAPASCAVPDKVQTATYAPGGLPSGIYTHVHWTLPTLSVGQVLTYQFVAAIPIHANTDTWTGDKPSDDSGDQGANLDNNDGPETVDGTSLPTYTVASGLYNGTLGVSGDATTTVTAKDMITSDAVDHSQIAVASKDIWTMTVTAGEYRPLQDVTVTATLPDGVCPVDAHNDSSSSECGPDGRLPSSPYQQVTENGDGSWSVVWDQTTDAALAAMAPDATTTITAPVIVRSHYGPSSSPTTPVLAGDNWSGSDQADSSSFSRCAPEGPDCDAGNQPISQPTDALAVSDSASAGQDVAQPVIAKTIDSRSSTPVNCATDNYVSTQPTYHPGDKVCFKLHVDFPGGTDTGGSQITDFLPPGTTYDTGSMQATGANTVTIGSVDATTNPGLLAIPLGSSGNVAQGQVLDAVYSVTIVDPTVANSGDVEGNLMKFANVNTGGTSFPQRAAASYTFAKALLSLTEGVDQVNGAPSAGNAANTDGTKVSGGDIVTLRVDVTNSGTVDASNAVVEEKIPSQLGCSATSAISDSGSCASDTITWTGVAIPAGQTKTLTYRYLVPSGLNAAVSLGSHAGVASYQSETDTGTPFTNIPAGNIDSGAGTANTAAADDTTNTMLASPTMSITGPTSVNETGNDASQATIGERIDPQATITLPAGVAGATGFAATLPANASYVSGSVSATLGGAALPGDWTVTEAGGTVNVGLPDGYVPSTAQTLVVTWSQTVDDVATNTAGGSLATPMSFAYTAGSPGSPTQVSSTLSNAIVEPHLSAALSTTASSPVNPGQTLTYTATLTNASATTASSANHLSAVVTVPTGETPVDASGSPVADDGTVSGGGSGVWSSTARTITFPAGSPLLPGASLPLAYRVSIDATQPSSSRLTATLAATTTSLKDAPTSPGTARTATSAGALSPAVSGYSASATSSVTLVDATVTKTVSVAASPCTTEASCSATIGNPATYTLTVTIPAGVQLHDALVRDIVPDGVSYDGSPTISGDVTATEIAHQSNSDGTTTLGFWLGEVPESPTARTVTISYPAHVLATKHDASNVADGQTLSGAATVDDNQSKTMNTQPSTIPAASAYTYISPAVPAAAAALDVIEPSITLTGTLTDGSAAAHVVLPGDTLDGTLTVTNDGHDTAYGVPVSDTPDARLVVLNDEATLTGGGDLTQQWTSATPTSEWMIPSLGPGASVTLSYHAKLVGSDQLTDGLSLNDPAAVGSYHGVSADDRAAQPAFAYRTYTGPTTPKSVQVNLPALTPTNTGSGQAQVGQPYTWQVAIQNSSANAPAAGAVLTYTLPANWTYVAGSANLGEPATIVAHPTGDTLTWPLGTVAAATTTTLTLQATPSLAAATTPGNGSAHPNQSTASVTWQDGSGSTVDQSGSYAAGPATGSAQLNIPTLALTAAPKAGTFTAGRTGTWTITVKNTGTVPARNVKVADVIPSDDPYAAAGASASPSTGFSESQYHAMGAETDVQWTIANLAADATTTITVPTQPPASTADATHFSTPVSAQSDETPTASTDTADATVDTSADVAASDSVAPDPGTPGTDVTYTLTAANGGPSDAQDVALSDTLDSSETFVAFSSGGGACSQTGQQISCAWPTVASGVSHEVDVEVALAPDAPGSVPNQASVSTTTADANSANDSASAPLGTARSADLTLSDSADAGHLLQGGDIHYTLTVTNHGPSEATGVSIADALPAEVSFASADADCTNSSGTVTCAVGSLAVGASATYGVTVHADQPGATTDAAVASSTSTDPHLADNTASAAVGIDPATDLAVTASGPATVQPAAQATYTLTATNHGPSDATGVVVTDTLPQGLSFDSASTAAGPCTDTGQDVSCPIGPLASGDRATVTVVASADYAAGGQTLTDQASVSGDQGDPDPSNDADSVTTAVGPASGISITDRVDNPAPNQQRQVTYALTYTNHGPTGAHGIVVADRLPAGVTFVSSDDPSCSQNAGVVTCDEPALANGASGTIYITATADQVGAQRDAASVTATEPDPDLADNQASAPITVGPTADLTLSTSTSTPQVPVGGVAVYTLAVTNHGPSDAHSVIVTAPLAPGVTFVGATVGNGGSCTVTGSTLTCSVPLLADGSTATVTVRLRPGFALAGTTLLGSASVGASEDDIAPKTASASSVTMAVGPAADLSVRSSAPTRAPAGGRLTDALTVTNAGPQPATNTTVVDTLPAGVHFDSAKVRGGSCSVSGRTLTCHLGTIPVGAVHTILLTTTVTAPAHAKLVNSVRVTADEPDPSNANNASRAATRVDPTTASARLRVTNVPGSPTLTLGRRVGYTITVTNRSHQAAPGVVLLDQSSRAVKVISVRTAAGSCHGLRCRLGVLMAGRHVTIHVVVRPLRPGALHNLALVMSDRGDGHGSRVSDVAHVTVHAAPTALAVAEHARRRTAIAGTTMRYDLMVHNRGSHTATNVTVCDSPAAAMTFVIVHGAHFDAGRPCWTIPALAPGATAHRHVTVRFVGSASGRVLNHESAWASNANRHVTSAAVRIRPRRSVKSSEGVTG